MELNFENTKVLLVDDDENYGFALKILLEGKGLKINSFTNPEEALEYLKKEKVDIILLDYYMPQMTGEQFLRQLREFDVETIVFLQTAFSEEKPQLEMLKTLNIQGYIDKNKEPNDIFLDIVTGIKMSELVKIIQEKDKQLDAQSCRNEFLGKFLDTLIGEIGERGMAMTGGIMILTEMENEIPDSQKEIFSHSVSTIKNSISKLNDLIKSLDIGEDQIIAGELSDKISNLFEITLAVKNVSLKFEFNDRYIMLNCNQEILIHIIVDIIENLVNNEEKEINIIIEKNEKANIRICSQKVDTSMLDKIVKLSYLDSRINVKEEAGQIVIVID